MIDPEVYLSKLFTKDIEASEFDEEILLAPDIDIRELEKMPAMLYTVTGDGQVANGDGLWSFILTVSFFGSGMDAAKKLARFGYDLVHGWNADPAATVLLIDGESTWVSEVDDIDVPTRLASAAIDGRNVVQYTGSWALALRN